METTTRDRTTVSRETEVRISLGTSKLLSNVLLVNIMHSFKNIWSYLSGDELCKTTHFVEKQHDMFLKGEIIGYKHQSDSGDTELIDQPPRRLYPLQSRGSFSHFGAHVEGE